MTDKRKEFIDERIKRGLSLDQAQLAYDREEARTSCDHKWHRAGHVGMCIVYECNKCGDSYEKDVS